MQSKFKSLQIIKKITRIPYIMSCSCCFTFLHFVFSSSFNQSASWIIEKSNRSSRSLDSRGRCLLLSFQFWLFHSDGWNSINSTRSGLIPTEHTFCIDHHDMVLCKFYYKLSFSLVLEEQWSSSARPWMINAEKGCAILIQYCLIVVLISCRFIFLCFHLSSLDPWFSFLTPLHTLYRLKKLNKAEHILFSTILCVFFFT